MKLIPLSNIFVKSVRPLIPSAFISLGASVPTKNPPQFLEKVLQEIDIKDLRYYFSRSTVGAGYGIKDATLKHFQKEGFDTKNSQPFFTHSTLDVLRLIVQHIIKQQSQSSILSVQPTYSLYYDIIKREGVKLVSKSVDQATSWKITPEVFKEAFNAMFIALSQLELSNEPKPEITKPQSRIVIGPNNDNCSYV